jgi:hypothetical protein
MIREKSMHLIAGQHMVVAMAQPMDCDELSARLELAAVAIAIATSIRGSK